MIKPCLFCSVPEEERILQSMFWFTRLDKFPVTTGHTLIIPNRHFCSIYEISPAEWVELHKVIRDVSVGRQFNLGINDGELAGQTIFHLHIHVFPRTAGDDLDPRGGIRNFKSPLVPYL
jgi:diadenosine tetraphosphate (Ap4A) HIT family hydrolase